MRDGKSGAESFQAAVQAGAGSLLTPADQFHGDRMAGVRDPFGNVWWLATNVKKVPGEEPQRQANALPGQEPRRAPVWPSIWQRDGLRAPLWRPAARWQAT
ncbi:MAG: hypothetical protein H7330_13170 [Hymenobacteraceae bacterium]|nr:hypothetical protein [Hymenobacteraceae bacterium]